MLLARRVDVQNFRAVLLGGARLEIQRLNEAASEKNKMASSLNIDLARMATARRTFMSGVSALDTAWTRG